MHKHIFKLDSSFILPLMTLIKASLPDQHAMLWRMSKVTPIQLKSLQQVNRHKAVEPDNVVSPWVQAVLLSRQVCIRTSLTPHWSRLLLLFSNCTNSQNVRLNQLVRTCTPGGPHMSHPEVFGEVSVEIHCLYHTCSH